MVTDLNSSAYIKNIKVFHSKATTSGYHSFHFFADGSPGVMFQLSDQGMVLNGKRKLSNLFLYGQTVTPIEITVQGNYRMIVVFLYPYIVKSLFGLDAKEITDTCIDLELLPLRGVTELKQRLTEDEPVELQIQQLTVFFSKLAPAGYTSIQPELQYVTHAIMKSTGNISLKELQEDLQLSERTLERKFLQHVGIPPTLYARICRFQAALTQINANTFDSLTAVAHEHGYADQSHFNRTFKEFTGLTPTEYIIQYRNMPTLSIEL